MVQSNLNFVFAHLKSSIARSRQPIRTVTQTAKYHVYTCVCARALLCMCFAIKCSLLLQFHWEIGQGCDFVGHIVDIIGRYDVHVNLFLNENLTYACKE